MELSRDLFYNTYLPCGLPMAFSLILLDFDYIANANII